jgi:hypothetical protein
VTTTTDAGASAPAAGPTGRLAVLLAEIRRQRGRWNTARVVRLYRRLGVAVPPERLRAIARGDLRDLAAWGHLTLHDQPSNKHYTLTRGESS